MADDLTLVTDPATPADTEPAQSVEPVDATTPDAPQVASAPVRPSAAPDTAASRRPSRQARRRGRGVQEAPAEDASLQPDKDPAPATTTEPVTSAAPMETAEPTTAGPEPTNGHAPAALDPTSPRGDIRHVIAAIRGTGEQESSVTASDAPATPSTPSAAQSPAPTAGAAGIVTTAPPIRIDRPALTPAAAADPRAAVAYAYSARPTPPRASQPVSARYEVRLAVIAAAIVAVTMMVGVGVSSLLPRVYAARTDVVFPVDSDRASGFLREDRRMLTHVEGLQSRTVLEPAAKEEGIAPEDLEEQVHIEVVNGSEVIRIEVWDRDAQRALRLTTRITALYRSSLGTDSGLTRAQDVLRREQQTLEARIAAISARLGELAPAIANIADPAGAERARREAAQLEAEAFRTYERIANVSNRLNELAVSNARLAPTRTVAEPYVLPDVVSPRLLWNAALAGSVGMVVAGAVVAFLWWRRTTEAE